MPFWSRQKGPAPAVQRGPYAVDEFVGDGGDRIACPLDLEPGPRAREWQQRLAGLTRSTVTPADLALSAFTLIRGGDLYQGPKRAARPRTDPGLLATYQQERISLVPNGAAAPEREAALQGSLRVLGGSPALCRRMLLAKPISLVIIPSGADFRSHGFPPSTNPAAAGIFWNGPEDRALIGLREELILEKPWLMVHEMTHAVHLLGLTSTEREDIDRYLVPVYRNRRWVEEVVAIYAERAHGARYTDAELASRDRYGQTRREWTDQAVFSKFIAELFRP